MKRMLWFFLMISMLLSTQIQAKPITAEQIPEPLKPWVDWVLLDDRSLACPFLYNSFKQKRCSWPARLKLNLHDQKADFSIHWKVYAESWLQLPGNKKHWPLNVTVNKKSALVMEKRGLPVIKLQAGEYDIAGQFLWDFIPDNLSIPKDTGLIGLSVKGEKIPFPAVKQGQLWLKDSDIKQSKPKSIQNKLDIQVFRRIIDDVPLQILSRLELEVSGDQREVKLALPLLEKFIPMRLQSPLPARIETDNSLLIQLRPGRWHIDLLTRHDQELKQLSFNRPDKNWPKQEIWVFDARPYQRLVEIENVTAIDAQLTNLPEAWKKLPAYRVNNGDTMVFNVIRRGDPEPEPNKLQLQRTLWLDFDGQGYTVNDRINGTMTRGWRLNALPETLVGKADLDGKNQLITRLPGADQEGIEVRKGAIELSADSRIAKPVKAVSAVGWQQTFHQVTAVLNLPPGWRLLAASGIDNVPDSWISRWTLLDLFLVLIAALAISRLWNIYWGVFALLTLAVIWHEPGAPRFVWLNILAAIALLQVLPTGRFFTFVKYYRNAFWLALVILLVPFMVNQVRMGLYPQLERPWQQISTVQDQVLGGVLPAESSRRQARPKSARKMSNQTTGLSETEVRTQAAAPSFEYYAADKAVNFQRIDPDANVQTGPGLPQWRWQKVNLSWNGPVDSQQQMRFWYLTPVMTMLLNFFRVIVTALLALLMFGIVKEKIKFKLPSVFLCLFVLTFTLFPAERAYADFPDKTMLDELQKRLQAAPDCLPGCAQIPFMRLKITPDVLSITLQIDSQQSVAVPLPAQFGQWFPTQVSVNKKIAKALYRSNDGKLWINLDKGKHTLEIKGMTPLLNKFYLPLPLNPHRIEIDKQGWLVEGVHENRSTAGLLHFNRLASDKREQQQAVLESAELPPFVRVEKTLQLGLDWRVETRIVRVSPSDSAIELKVPLLPGESVITAGVRVRDGKVLVNMRARQTVLQWKSVLKKTATIDLVAATTNQWTEVWRADVGPIWHLQMSGIAVVHHQDKQGRWLPEWRPWPGEKVTLTITRPEAVAGQTLTIDNSKLQITPGKRSMEAVLEVTIRSSQGTQHTLIIPENSVLQSVKIDGKTQPIRQKGTQVTVPIKPGKQAISLNWHKTSPISTYVTTPAINLGAASVNTNLKMNLGGDRWILITSGPAIGPAVLFWGILIVIIIISFGLGRVPVTPLKHWQWFLLLIGLSQIPVAAAIVVVAWLVLLGLRGNNTLQNRSYFNATQAGLGLLTLVSLVFLFAAIRQGLLGSPDMQIIGNQSSAYNLNWYQDRSAALLPEATVISVSLTVYRLLMLAWSLWLAVSLLNWLKWGWGCFSNGGIWKKAEPKKQITAGDKKQKN